MGSTRAASTLELEEARSTVAEAPGRNFCWPVWRYGQVLRPADGESLLVSDAKQIGPLFEPGGLAVVRYLRERMAELERDVARLGGKLWREWPAHLRHGSEPFQVLEKTWDPENAVISYSFVPIVRLPAFLVEMGGASWRVRESLTICGEPAKSKAWITASLIAWRDNPTDSRPMGRQEVGEARRHLSALTCASLASLTRYYQKVLCEDTADLSLERQPPSGGFDVVAEVEIVSVASSLQLNTAFDLLETTGVRRFSEEAPNDEPSRAVLDFLDWTASDSSFGPGDWEPGKAKILAIYANEPACGTVRALVVPRLDSRRNRTAYAVLSERIRPEKPVNCYPLSEAAGRFLAMEFGRYF
ncbi:MAG TPA: hypothetical protein VH394_28520 [Thermoanaerobaculia bacterium]|jgi:hypothetical protein|nr:hypothetical protein [Thermoanaerobaculia bacterium]